MGLLLRSQIGKGLGLEECRGREGHRVGPEPVESTAGFQRGRTWELHPEASIPAWLTSHLSNSRFPDQAEREPTATGRREGPAHPAVQKAAGRVLSEGTGLPGRLGKGPEKLFHRTGIAWAPRLSLTHCCLQLCLPSPRSTTFSKGQQTKRLSKSRGLSRASTERGDTQHSRSGRPCSR